MDFLYHIRRHISQMGDYALFISNKDKQERVGLLCSQTHVPAHP